MARLGARVNAATSAIAYYNKAVIYRLLFEVAAETLTTFTFLVACYTNSPK